MKCAVISICKLENNYLREWVEWHKKIGFDNIILSDNNELDGEHPEDVIKDYINDGFVIIEDYRGHIYDNSKSKEKNVQIVSYNNNYNKYINYYDWFAFIDIDEFLILKDSINIKDFLSQEKFNDYKCIKLFWRVYTDNNLVRVINNDYSINRFTTYLTKDYSYQVKSIIRSNSDIKDIGGAHGFINWDKNFKYSCNAKGVKVYTDAIYGEYYNPVTFECAYINHYQYKTIEEFIKRFQKRYWNSSFYTDYIFKKFFEENERTEEKIIFIKENYPELEKYFK